MAVRDIVLLGDPRLREVCEEIADPRAPQVLKAIDDLRDTLAQVRSETGYGRAISAPQIGVLSRLIFVHIDEDWPLLNPSIVAHSEEAMVVWDACLSYLTLFFQVRRFCWIDVRYQDLDGAWHTQRCEDDRSELLQHEIDHLDGVLAIDRITDLKTLCSREEFEKRYREQSPYATSP
jgi:peptide deformylase